VNTLDTRDWTTPGKKKKNRIGHILREKQGTSRLLGGGTQLHTKCSVWGKSRTGEGTRGGNWGAPKENVLKNSRVPVLGGLRSPVGGWKDLTP